MKLKDAIEWAHRAEPAEVFISSHPRRTQDALWLLVHEVERLAVENKSLVVEVGHLKQSLWPTKDEQIARWKDSYENMRDFAVKSGLDITCYGAESV